MIQCSCCPGVSFPDSISALFYISFSGPTGTVVCAQRYLGLKWQPGGSYALTNGAVVGITSISAQLACITPGTYLFSGSTSFDLGNGCSGSYSGSNVNSCASVGGGVPFTNLPIACCGSINYHPNGTVYMGGGMVPMANPINQIFDDCEAAGDGASVSSGPVRYSSGELVYQQSDVPGGSGFGIPWGHTRSFAPRLSENESIGQGYNWQVAQWPYLVLANPATVVLMGQAQRAVFFDLQGNQYIPRFNVKKSLVLDTVNQVYRLTNLDGSYTEYDELLGMMVRIVDVAGNTLVVSNSRTSVLC